MIINFEFKLTGSLDVDEDLSQIEREQFVENMLEKLFLSTNIEVEQFETNVISKEEECKDSYCESCNGTGISTPSTGSVCRICNGSGC
jgi:DnaJ-class molecular chaperone